MSFHSVVQAEAGMEKRKRKKEKKKKEAIMNMEGDWRGKMDLKRWVMMGIQRFTVFFL